MDVAFFRKKLFFLIQGENMHESSKCLKANTVVGGCLWIIVMFYQLLDSHSDGTHSLQRIHWWTNDVMLHFSKSVLMRSKLIYILHSLRANFSFVCTVPLKWKCTYHIKQKNFSHTHYKVWVHWYADRLVNCSTCKQTSGVFNFGNLEFWFILTSEDRTMTHETLTFLGLHWLLKEASSVNIFIKVHKKTWW